MCSNDMNAASTLYQRIRVSGMLRRGGRGVRGASVVGIGDLAQAGEGLAELEGGLFAQVGGPFGLDLGFGLPGHFDRGPAAAGDLYQPGPGIAGIGNPADVTVPLELVDQEAGRLLGDQGPARPGR
jgi:hypothetical protein